jgi:putative spermidine/putrescine transport system ATP-binding protein
MSARLELRGLTRDYGGAAAPALSGLNLTIQAGSCLAVVGPSGSGKSTLLRLASGLDRPDEGDVLLDGASVLDVAAEERGMAMVFQRPLLFPHRNVLDNVAFAGRARGASRREARAEAADYLALVHLSELARRRPGELSGGQAQRVALARALAARPRVLLLDEPFNGLDGPLAEEMHDLLRQVRRALQPTIVLVTHDKGEAAAVADEVAVLAAGRLEQHGPIDEIYSRPSSLVVARLMGGRNEIPGLVRGHHHDSVLGSLRLPVDVRPPEGPGLLVFRQESVQVTDVDDAADAVGTVAAVRPIGARRLVAVDVTAGAATSSGEEPVLVYAETPPGHRAAAGDRVGLRLSPHALAVVPAGTVDPSSPAVGPSVRTGALPADRHRAASDGG